MFNKRIKPLNLKKKKKKKMKIKFFKYNYFFFELIWFNEYIFLINIIILKLKILYNFDLFTGGSKNHCELLNLREGSVYNYWW
jgi:hypothetical protein